METLSNVMGAILAALVAVVGWAIVGGALVFLALIVVLNLWELACAAKRKIHRSIDSTQDWWP